MPKLNRHQLSLVELEGLFGICRLAPDLPIPSWASTGSFLSITRTGDELSIVCPEAAVPDEVRCERGWRCLRVAGNLPFDAVGVLASLVEPMANAGISVFAISTFDTDYLLVKDENFTRALAELTAAGHTCRQT